MKKVLFFIGIFTVTISFSQGTQLLREPSISNNEVVFVYANDLWKTSINGGRAIRLTSNEGAESNPKFSKDGSMIAFTAEYDGNKDVYIIPSNGGEPKRLTYHPSPDFVQGWTPDGKVLFRSSREAKPTQTNKFFKVSIKGGLPTTLDITRAAFGEISEDGKYIAYTPITSWDKEWRNYRGGQAMPIWIVNLKTKELIRTPQPDNERHLNPVWFNGVVYYLSERDYASNIWSFNPITKEEKQLTFHKKFDVKNLDAENGKLIYEQGGYLHLLEIATNKHQQLNINVEADLNFSRPRWENVYSRSLDNPNISPNGKRVLFEHRGEIFSVPKEYGTWRNITNSPGVADRSPIWSPKGDKIAWFSDKNGEYEMVIANQKGENPQYISLPNKTFYFKPDWSPDGKKIAYTDTDFNVWIVNIETKKVIKVDTDGYAHPSRTLNPVWSPDSKWIAYAKQNNSHFKSIYVYNIDYKKVIPITDPIADAINPIWDENGKCIYILASTNYGLNTGWLDMSSYDPSITRNLYAIILNSKDKAPNLPKSDEEEKKKEESDKSKKKDTEDKKPTTVTIDENGILDRAVAMKLPERNYTGLYKGLKNHVFVAESITNKSGITLHDYDIEKQKAKDFATEISRITSAVNGKNILFYKNENWNLADTKNPPKGSKEKLKTNIKIKVDPKAEYHQIFKEGWRFMRDFLYVDNVHGAPWNKVYKWYSPWINHVRHRSDLNYVIDIMSGEVAVGHSYVYGGDSPDVKQVPVGLLGVDLQAKNGYYQITKIYKGGRWNPVAKSPLGMPGLDIKEGDYLVSINGKPLTTNINPYSLLEQTANREIIISTNTSPSSNGAKSVVVKPIISERRLRNIEWVEDNRKKVDKLSNGKLAYVYVPNTSGAGFESFNRYYFSQQDKKGVIIDERNNGGGSAADYIIDIMSRNVIGYFNSRANNHRPWTTPMAGIWGPKVMIINERSGSGGDLLPYMFKYKKLGPLVGTKTWGGLVGTWDTPRFIDGGRMVAPRGGFYDINGKWAVEGEGVAPDIEAIQHPKETTKGNDPQLEKAVEEALRLLQTKEFYLQPEPVAPVRSKRPKGFKK